MPYRPEVKRSRWASDEAEKPLTRYREEELAAVYRKFYGCDPSDHIARNNFVRKVLKSQIPVTIARHRDRATANPELIPPAVMTSAWAGSQRWKANP